MVHVKKTLLLFCAMILAFLAAEIVIKNIIGYPPYGVKMKVFGIQNFTRTQKIYLPNSPYWVVEGGNHVYYRNNLGLPGTDIRVADSQKFIFILGSSFMEAYQMPPGKMASSLFFSSIQKADPDLQVLDLGSSGHDPYDSYFRALYFTRSYKPDKIILLLDNIYSDWMKRHRHPLDFEPSSEFGREDNRFTTRISTLMRNNFSILDLFIRAVSKKNNEDPGESPRQTDVQAANTGIPDMQTCLQHYASKYGADFTCLSIIPDTTINRNLASFCKTLNINFRFDPCILIPENRINQNGHLNEKGNYELGKFITGSFAEIYQK